MVKRVRARLFGNMLTLLSCAGEQIKEHRTRAPSMESLSTITCSSSTLYYSDLESSTATSPYHTSSPHCSRSFEHAPPVAHLSPRFEELEGDIELELPRKEESGMPSYREEGLFQHCTSPEAGHACVEQAVLPFPPPPLEAMHVGLPYQPCGPAISHLPLMLTHTHAPHPAYYASPCACLHSCEFIDFPAPHAYQASLWQTAPDPLYLPLLHSHRAPDFRPRGPSPHNTKAELYKTEMCRSWSETGNCRYEGKCQFAHGYGELRAIPGNERGRGRSASCMPAIEGHGPYAEVSECE